MWFFNILLHHVDRKLVGTQTHDATRWIERYIRIKATILDVLNVIQDRVSMGESLSYELHKNYTVSSNPELLHLDAGDVLVSEENG